MRRRKLKGKPEASHGALFTTEFPFLIGNNGTFLLLVDNKRKRRKKVTRNGFCCCQNKRRGAALNNHSLLAEPTVPQHFGDGKAISVSFDN